MNSTEIRKALATLETNNAYPINGVFPMIIHTRTKSDIFNDHLGRCKTFSDYRERPLAGLPEASSESVQPQRLSEKAPRGEATVRTLATS